MLSACVFEKRFQKASGQHLLMILESFWDPFWSNFDPGGTLGGSLGPPWDTFGPRPQKSTKNHQKDPFFRPHFGDLFSSSFPYFPYIFKLHFWEPSEPLFNGFWGHFGTTSGVVFPTFWRHWKPWKMQPLQCETTVFEYPEARLFIIFLYIFQDKF